MGETDDFNTLVFEKKLTQLKDTQESIQSMSSWCLQQRIHHKKIVASWLNVLKRVKVEQRLVLFYLANDVIQYSKRKNYEFVDSWGLNLQKATPLVRDEKVRPKILRIFKIWEQRSVYDEEFLSDLTGLLSAGAIKKSDEDSSSDFQPQQLVNKIKQCTVLEADTDLRLKYIHESHLQLSDADALCANLKDRSHKDDVEKELNEGIACVERYTQALQREIVAREALLALLSSASEYYLTQMGEVKVVAYAYKTFGTRVRALKRKLDDLIPTLPNAAPSPPQRDEDVPSPGPDEDLDLPAPESADDDDLAYNIDQTFNTTLGADGSLYNMGLSSFLTSDNPMAIFNDSIDSNINSANKIEVINTRPNEKPDFNINDFLKNLIPAENNSTAIDTISVASGSLSQKSQDTLPGLDLLTPESTGNPPPPTSFYGSMNSITEDLDQPYHPETSAPWTNNTWNVAPNAVGVGLGVGAVFAEPPESPPRQPLPPPPETPTFPQELPPVSDVDHRGILPPPPPPPVLPLLGNLEDVDHRLLAVPPPLVSTPSTRHPVMHQDVDHRNLISLTQAPRAPVPRPMNPIKLDQDYRVPPLVVPSDIVESVDMDLSEDEEQQGLYQNQQMQSEHPRRHSFNNNNNKVLVGGDNGKTNHIDHNHTNLIPINKIVEKEPHSAPILPMVNPFDVMPPILKNINDPGQIQFPPPSFPNREYKVPEEIPKDNACDENMRAANIDTMNCIDNVLPAMGDYEDFSNNSEWQNQSPRPFMNQRFPRNWAPRTNFRGQAFGPRQFWPRSAPRPPPNRWMAPRPQRFW